MRGRASSRYVKLYSDSFCVRQYFHCDILKYNRARRRDTLLTSPHRMVLPDETKFSFEWDNRSCPGMSMRSFLRSRHAELERWARNLPLVTIIHLGAIDVNNRMVAATGAAFGHYVLNFLNRMKDIAKRNLSPQEATTFENKLRQQHRFIWLGLPDWGPDYNPRFQNSLTAAQYKNARRRINATMKNSFRRRLWENHNCVIFTPNTDNPERNGIHLTPAETKKFAQQVARVAARLLCTYCRIEMSGDYNEDLHQPDVLKSGRCNWG